MFTLFASLLFSVPGCFGEKNRVETTYVVSTLEGIRLIRERVRAKLELYSLACHALAAFHMPGCASRIRRPEPFAFPAGFRIIDSAIQALREEAHRIGNAEDNELSSLWIQRR